MAIKDPNTENMVILIKKGEEMERYEATDELAQGEGTRAGVAYRMKDGSSIYVPE